MECSIILYFAIFSLQCFWHVSTLIVNFVILLLDVSLSIYVGRIPHRNENFSRGGF